MRIWWLRRTRTRSRRAGSCAGSSSALEYLLSELLLEKHGFSEGFDGFTEAPGHGIGRSVTADGILEMTGAAYVFGPPYSLWPFHGKLVPHPRESVLCLAGRSAIVAMGTEPLGKNAPRQLRARAHREAEKDRARGRNVAVPPQPRTWRYVMTTILPDVQAAR